MGMIGAKYVDPQVQQVQQSHRLQNNQRQKILSQGANADFEGLFIPLSPSIPLSPGHPLSVRQEQSIPLSGRQAYQRQVKQLFSPRGASLKVSDQQTNHIDSITDNQSIMKNLSTYRGQRNAALNNLSKQSQKRKQREEARTFLDAMKEKALQFGDQRTMRNHQLQQAQRCKQNQKSYNQGKLQKTNQVEKILVENMQVTDENCAGQSPHASTAFHHYEGTGLSDPLNTQRYDSRNVQVIQTFIQPPPGSQRSRPHQNQDLQYHSRDPSLDRLGPKQEPSDNGPQHLIANNIEKTEDSIMGPSYNQSKEPNHQCSISYNYNEPGSKQHSVDNPSKKSGASFPQRENSKISDVSKSNAGKSSRMKQATDRTTPQRIQLRDKQKYDKKNFIRFLKEKSADANPSGENPPPLPVVAPLNLDIIKAKLADENSLSDLNRIENANQTIYNLIKQYNLDLFNLQKSEESMASGLKSGTEQSDDTADGGRFSVGAMSPKMGVLIKGIKLEPIEVKAIDDKKRAPQVPQEAAEESGRRSKGIRRSGVSSPFSNIQSQVFQQYENIKKLQLMQQELITIQLNKTTGRSEEGQQRKEAATGIDGRENEESVLMKNIASQQEMIQDGLLKCQQQIQERQEGLISGALGFKNAASFQQQPLDTVIKIVSQHQGTSHCQSPHWRGQQAHGESADIRKSSTNETLMLQYPRGHPSNGNGAEILDNEQTPRSSRGRGKDRSSLYEQSDFPNNPMNQARYNKLSIEGENVPTLTQVSFGAGAKDSFTQSLTKNTRERNIDLQSPAFGHPNETTNNTPRAASLLYQLQGNMHSRDGSKNASYWRERPNMEVIGRKLERLSPSKQCPNKRSQGIQGDPCPIGSAPTTDRQGDLDSKEVACVQENPIDTLQEFIAAYCGEFPDGAPNLQNVIVSGSGFDGLNHHNYSTAVPIQEEDPGLIPEGLHAATARQSPNTYATHTDNISPSCRSPIAQTQQNSPRAGKNRQRIEADAPHRRQQQIPEERQQSPERPNEIVHES